VQRGVEGKELAERTKSVIIRIPKRKRRLSRLQQLYRAQQWRLLRARKVLMLVLLERLKAPMLEEQAAFRKDRNITLQTLILRLLAEKAKRKNRPIYHCFIDFQKAFDSIQHDVTWATLNSYSVGRRLLYTAYCRTFATTQSVVRVGKELEDWFETTVSTRQHLQRYSSLCIPWKSCEWCGWWWWWSLVTRHLV